MYILRDIAVCVIEATAYAVNIFLFFFSFDLIYKIQGQMYTYPQSYNGVVVCTAYIPNNYEILKIRTENKIIPIRYRVPP